MSYSVFKKIKKTGLIFATLFWGFLVTSVSQTNTNLNTLIQGVQIKSKKSKTAFLSKYQHIFKFITESEKSHQKSEYVYEQYCLNDGKSFCRVVLIEKNGVPLSKSKIDKARQKAAKNLSKQNDFVGKDDPFGYGTLVGSVWIDPTLYLRDYQMLSSKEQKNELRKTILVNLGKCQIDNEPAEWKKYLDFMPKTEAKIWIDVQDESVTRLNIYADKEFSGLTVTDKPIATMDNIRMPEGYWLFGRIHLETTNKLIFPNLQDNFDFEFSAYKPIKVEVNSNETKLSK